MDEMLVMFGGGVKALGNGKVGGYLVTFGSPAQVDLEGDFFTPDTDYDVDFPGKSTVLYQHGFDSSLKLRKLASGSMKIDDTGVWLEAQLAMRDDYEKAIYKLAEDDKLGWSSGTASHLVERKQAENGAWEITRWPLGLDASLTPTPAEWRSKAVPLKAWIKSAKLLDPGEDVGEGIDDMYDYFDDIEEGLCRDVLRSLQDTLYWCVTNVLYNDAMPVTDAMDYLRTQFDRFRDLSLSTFAAILSNEADETPEEAANSIKAAFGVYDLKKVSGATSLPLAPRDHSWDSGAATKRVKGYASATDGPNGKYAKAFMAVDGDTKEFGSYKLPFADVIDGELTAIPRAIFAIAAVLQGSRGGVEMSDADRTGVKARVARYYARMRREFKDDSITVPWSADGAGKGKSLRFDQVKNERDYERFLRDAGVPKAAAAALISGGIKTLLRRDTAEQSETNINSSLYATARALELKLLCGVQP